MFVFKSPTISRLWEEWWGVIISASIIICVVTSVLLLDKLIENGKIAKINKYALVDGVYHKYPIVCSFGVAYRYKEIQRDIHNKPVACKFTIGTTAEIRKLGEIR
jgi:hypothetical protein